MRLEVVRDVYHKKAFGKLYLYRRKNCSSTPKIDHSICHSSVSQARFFGNIYENLSIQPIQEGNKEGNYI